MSARQNFMEQHFFKKDGYYDMTASGEFLMMAGFAYAPKEHPKPGMRERVDEILASAARAGFGQSDVFTTLLAKGGISERTLRLACEVTTAVGGDATMFHLIQIAPKGVAQ
ncbi:hypothetical protein [Rugamonas rubra]|uniref:Uncharacterized protein n=1 Tax=Rugamonas rubra TaxID=758825 RepID=A0A1I4SI79_9BURK|nr:hypothetical protein [Rugamonas rubra]SFM64208.1 hypothetical protein SAMN02982985_04795 [Rugamonas rubra]